MGLNLKYNTKRKDSCIWQKLANTLGVIHLGKS